MGFLNPSTVSWASRGVKRPISTVSGTWKSWILTSLLTDHLHECTDEFPKRTEGRTSDAVIQ